MVKGCLGWILSFLDLLGVGANVSFLNIVESVTL